MLEPELDTHVRSRRLEARALAELAACGDEAALRAWHTKYFGKQGEVPAALKKIGEVPPDQQRAFGQEANRVKEALTPAYEAADARAKEQALAQPGRGRARRDAAGPAAAARPACTSPRGSCAKSTPSSPTWASRFIAAARSRTT